MFLVGLGFDATLLRGRGHTSVVISHTSIIVPFALGALLALYLYPRLADPAVRFSSFTLFIGAAMSITAFPVLARILVERRLMRSKIGALTITCAAVDDVTAWCILAFVGSIVPKRAGFAQLLAERLEDLVVVFLLPLFFAYSGLRTQIGLLDSPQAWGMCALVIAVACVGKFGGSSIAARLTGLRWREAAALGILMNT